MIEAKFKFERETKGAVRFQEVGADGAVLDQAAAKIGTLYIRKSALAGGELPKALLVKIDVE
jgi:hypothetical protein